MSLNIGHLIPESMWQSSRPLRAIRRLANIWDQNRWYSYTPDVEHFTPLAINPKGERTLVILSASNTTFEVLWSLYSILLSLDRNRYALVIALDMGLKDRTVMCLKALFPGCVVKSCPEILYGCFPDGSPITRYAMEHPLGRKLGVILALQRDTTIVYSDSDVVAFQNLVEVEQSDSPAFLQEQETDSVDPKILDRFLAAGIMPPVGFNSGFLRIPRESMDVGFVEQVLERGEYTAGCWFTEQSLLAGLFAGVGGTALPTDRYLVSADGRYFGQADIDYSAIALRHFTSPVRHLMYRKGLPAVTQRASALNLCRTTIGSGQNSLME